jgi:hypothetical protein
MKELLAQTPDRSTDPPVEAKVEQPVVPEQVTDDLVLEALGIGTPETQEPEVVEVSEVRDASGEDSYEAAVARFRSMIGGS